MNFLKPWQMDSAVMVNKVLNLDKTSWKLTKVGDLAKDVSKRVDNPGESEYDRFVGLGNFVSGEIKINTWETTENLASSAKAFKSGDILFARRNAYLRRASLVDFDGCCSGDAFVLRENHDKVVPGFLAFLMNSNAIWDYANSNAAGTMSKRVKWRDLAEYKFLLPPKDQQAQLSKLLWAMDEVIEKERELHNRAHSTYLSMRSNLMIGKEIIDFETKENYKKVKKFGQIPVNWEVKKLSELCVKIQDGNYGESYPKKDELLKDGVPFITSTIISGDNFDDTKLKYISEEKHLILKKAHVKSEDILLTNRGANVGRCAITPERMDDANIGPQVTLIRCDSDNLNNQYLYHFIRSNYVQKQIEIANAGSAMNFMSLTATGAFSIVCPSLETQKLISNRLNLIYSKLESIELKIKGSQSLQKSLINQIF